MLYYIIPPIIIVIALAILVGFLFKKSNELREIIAANQQEAIEKKKAKFSKVSPYALKFLERLMQKFKLMSLKFYNHSDQWFQSLKQKREKRQEQNRKMEIEQSQLSNSNRSDYNKYEVVEKNESRKNKLEVFFGSRTKKVNPVGISNEVDNIKDERKVKIHPIISKKVVRPEAKTQKNMLEEILIERIAVNPRDIEAYERLGDYYIENNNLNDSLECFRQVLKLSPANRKARMNVRKIESILAN